MTATTEYITKIEDENDRLKAQLKRLKAKIKRLKEKKAGECSGERMNDERSMRKLYT